MIQKPTAGKDVLAHNLVIISPVNRRSITRVWVSVEAQYSEFACTKYCRGGGGRGKKKSQVVSVFGWYTFVTLSFCI